MNKYMMTVQFEDGSWQDFFSLEAETAMQAVMIFARDADAQGETYIGVTASLED